MQPSPKAEEAREDARRSPFTAGDVEAIARRQGWLPADSAKNGGVEAEQESIQARRDWMAEAAQLLGTQAADLPSLERLLVCVFSYDAAQLLARAENQAALSREGARDVLRELAARVLDGPAIDSNRFKEIVAALKTVTGRRGPELFHPIRLALAGCAGEGEYDRVILLLDAAARLPWSAPLKSCRQRILEFCGVLD